MANTTRSDEEGNQTIEAIITIALVFVFFMCGIIHKIAKVENKVDNVELKTDSLKMEVDTLKDWFLISI